MIDPFDPSTDADGLLAVSALVDGIATDADRTRVAADPELGALVEDLLAARGPLRSVALPEADRDRIVAAALAEFDSIHQASTGGGSAEPTNVRHLAQRRRWYGVLSGAAAAAVAVVFVGNLVGDDGDPSVAVDATAPAVAEARSTMGSAAIDDAAGMVTGSGNDAGAPAPDATGPADQAGAATPAAIEVTAAPMAAAELAPAETEGAPGGTIASIDGAAEVVSIASPGQLETYARSQGPVIPLPGLGFPCVAEGTEAIGEVTYQGIAAIVVRDPATGEVRAHDLQAGCAVLVKVSP